MRPGRKPQLLTEKELVIMNMLWDRGPLFVREMVGIHEEPKPHFNTLSTIVRILEEKGHVAHETFGPTYRYYAISKREDFQKRSIARLVKDYFSNSYKNAVSALVEDEQLSNEDLKEIMELIDKKCKD
ncbi:MAG: BlaI/MecI/CopY family transcriptional regulator [Bacteroides sp.]|nr:BlaI/MecI/CopY family transcriptional regulator [Bacteroides sp.]